SGRCASTVRRRSTGRASRRSRNCSWSDRRRRGEAMRSGFTAEDVGALTGRRFLVTGANVGIGYETAKVLAARGAHVVLACRDAARAEAAMAAIRADEPKAEMSFLRLDLADLDQVREAAAAVLAGP